MDQASKFIIIGTAGHVDHGKTTLIQRLTGVDTDRWAEEKRRGMTIDLGFAPFQLPNGIQAGIIDVPGHQKFLKNMLAGIGGIDLVLLVVAANEGVMPQTREHLDILQLLQIPAGLVVLTKTDLVDAELLELAVEDVREALAGTFLAEAPILPVSGTSGEGMPELVKAIAQLAATVPAKSAAGPLRLPVDRAFLQPGFGAVVTGTLVRGRVATGDTVEILPRGLTARVRQVQVHNRTVASAQAGQRCALNLAGVDLEALERGEVIAAPGSIKPTSRLDLRLRLLPHAPPLKEGTRVRIYLGSAEVMGRVGFIAVEEGKQGNKGTRGVNVLKPGGEGFVQVRLEQPLAADFDERVVLRLYSPMRTIGGGVVVNPAGDKRRARTLQQVEAYNQADYAAVVEKALRLAPESRLPLGRLEELVPAGEWPAAWAALEQSGRALRWGQPLQAIHRDGLAEARARLLQGLAGYHQGQPWRAGAGQQELQAMLRADLAFLQFVLAGLRKEGVVARLAGDVWRLSSHQPRLEPAQQRALEQMRELLAAAPAVDRGELAAGLPGWAADLVQGLVAEGEALEIGPEVLASPARDRLNRERIRAYLAEHEAMTASQFRDLLGTTRKFAIPLLEYYDRQGVTRRVGDTRVLGAKA